MNNQFTIILVFWKIKCSAKGALGNMCKYSNKNKKLCFLLIYTHCVKSGQTRSFFSSVFSRIRTEYKEILVSLRIQSECRKIQTRKNSVFGHFSRNDDDGFAFAYHYLSAVPKKIDHVFLNYKN